MTEQPARKKGRPRVREQGAGVRALDRGLVVLEVLSQAAALSLTELGRKIDLPYSTTHRILETLRNRGFVVQSPDTGLYGIGIRAFEVGASFLSREPLQEAARPVMTKLAEEVNETVNLAVLDGAHAVYVQQVEGRHMMRAFTRIGARAPLYCTGVGKILLAWKSPEEVRDILAEEEFRSFTPNTIVGLSEFERELQWVRNAGYAVDNEERELGVRCVTVPVRNHTGEVAAALSMSAPAARLSDSRTVEVYQQIRRASDEIASRAGWR